MTPILKGEYRKEKPVVLIKRERDFARQPVETGTLRASHGTWQGVGETVLPSLVPPKCPLITTEEYLQKRDRMHALGYEWAFSSTEDRMVWRIRGAPARDRRNRYASGSCWAGADFQELGARMGRRLAALGYTIGDGKPKTLTPLQVGSKWWEQYVLRAIAFAEKVRRWTDDEPAPSPVPEADSPRPGRFLYIAFLGKVK